MSSNNTSLFFPRSVSCFFQAAPAPRSQKPPAPAPQPFFPRSLSIKCVVTFLWRTDDLLRKASLFSETFLGWMDEWMNCRRDKKKALGFWLRMFNIAKTNRRGYYFYVSIILFQTFVTPAILINANLFCPGLDLILNWAWYW